MFTCIYAQVRATANGSGDEAARAAARAARLLPSKGDNQMRSRLWMKKHRAQGLAAQVCPICIYVYLSGIKFGERNFFWAWYKLKLICLLYFHFVPSPDKVPLAKFFPERGGGQIKWNRQYLRE